MNTGPRLVDRGLVCTINCSTGCENSGFWWHKVMQFLRRNGYRLTTDPTGCPTVLINTCCVTQGRIQQVQETIASLWDPRQRIIVFGCLAGLEHSPRVDHALYIAPGNISSLEQLFEHDLPIDMTPGALSQSDALCSYQEAVGPDDAFVMIAQGCVNHCSYCNIKHVKGAVRSEALDSIVGAVRAALRAGHHELTLLGDDCGSYGLDGDTDLVWLLDELRCLDTNLRVKLYSLFPAAFLRMSEPLIRMAADGFITYMNIPLQSGAPRVLKQMRRFYDPVAIARELETLRARAPKTWRYTHFIVGFPGETDEEFEASLDLAPLFDEVLFLTYSDNPGTPAYSLFPKVDAATIASRMERARERLPHMPLQTIVPKATTGPRQA